MNKKGFTLIELLAVILVLGLIAIVAVPMVNKIIGEAQAGAAKSSASGIVKAVDNYIMLSYLGGRNLKSGEYSLDGVIMSFNGVEHEIDYKGTKGTGTIEISGTKVMRACIYINEYEVYYNGNEYVLEECGEDE